MSWKPDFFSGFPPVVLAAAWTRSELENTIPRYQQGLTLLRSALSTHPTEVARITKLTVVRSQLWRVSLLTFLVSRIEKKTVPCCGSVITEPEMSRTGNCARPGPRMFGWSLGGRETLLRLNSTSLLPSQD